MPLQEVYKIGRLHLQGGISCSGHFYHPNNIKPVMDEEYLSNFLADGYYQKSKDVIDQLKVFYDDSATWLMYDSEENVYCGGFECGDFYKSSKKLDEVLDIIFTKLINEEDLYVETFAPR